MFRNGSGVDQVAGLLDKGTSDSEPPMTAAIRARRPGNQQTGGQPHATR